MAKTGSQLTSNAARDASNGVLPYAGSFQTNDSTGSSKTSPLTVSNSVITIVVPNNAVRIRLYSTANDVRVSDISAATTYFVLKVSTLMTIDCSKMQNLYLLRDGGSDATLQFIFELI